MTIKENEKYVNNQIEKLLYDSILYINDSINEDSGHPLFKYGDPEETFDWINRIKNVINVINEKIKNASPKQRYKVKFDDEYETSYIYDELTPITISINKLGFKDVINTQKSSLKIVVNNVISGGNDYDTYILLRDQSCGHCNWSITRKLINGKFINTDQNSEIIYVKCWAIDGKIIPISFLLVFLHEYLHYYEQYNRLTTNTLRSAYVDIRSNRIARNNINLFNFTKDESEALDQLIYHLYLGEDNAKIGNLFSDLISLEITNLSEFNIFKDKINAFYVYNQLKKYLNIIKNSDDDTLAKYIKANKALITNKNIDITKYSDYQVVKKFITYLEKQLNKYYERLMRFVGRYIYMHQEYENKVVTSIKQE